MTPGAKLVRAESRAPIDDNSDMIGTVRFLGGTGAVSQTVRDQVAQLLN